MGRRIVTTEKMQKRVGDITEILLSNSVLLNETKEIVFIKGT